MRNITNFYYANITSGSARIMIRPGSASMLNCGVSNPLWVSQSPASVSSPLSPAQSARYWWLFPDSHAWLAE
ncbi:hypothetical protein [Dickeya oryzae]|uniref:hypothetical protein n=1 Tax=Dickeya oryzae TaxID=1240404 RepID=UPI0030B86756